MSAPDFTRTASGQPVSARTTARWVALHDRLVPDQDTLETRIGAPFVDYGLSSAARRALVRLGWRELTDGRWLRDLTEAPRTMAAALGAAYLGTLHTRPELWDRVLTFTRSGKRTISDVGLSPEPCHAGGPLPAPHDPTPEDMAAIAGALYCAHRAMRPRTPWGKVPPVERSLEAIARTCLPPGDPSVVVDRPIPPSYLAAFGTASE